MMIHVWVGLLRVIVKRRLQACGVHCLIVKIILTRLAVFVYKIIYLFRSSTKFILVTLFLCDSDQFCSELRARKSALKEFIRIAEFHSYQKIYAFGNWAYKIISLYTYNNKPNWKMKIINLSLSLKIMMKCWEMLFCSSTMYVSFCP